MQIQQIFQHISNMQHYILAFKVFCLLAVLIPYIYISLFFQNRLTFGKKLIRSDH